MSDNPMREAARDYFKLGFSVIPIRPNDKRPALTSWMPSQKKAWGPKDINDWWGQNPTHNIGIVTGQISGISVVDVDGPEGRKAIKDAGIEFPPTRVHATPNDGWHLIFQYDKGFKQGQGLLNHVDIRNDGGYIVAPPSTLETGEYTVLRDRAIASTAIPQALSRNAVDEAKTRAATKERTLRPQWASQLLANPPEQPGRNAAAAKLAGYFHRQGLPGDVIIELLTPWAAQCTPPFDLNELIATVGSIAQYDRTILHVDEVIPEPNVTVQPNGRMQFEWELERIVIDLERIRLNGSHAPCLMTVKKDGNVVYGPVTFDALSGNNRASHRRELGSDAPWGGYFSWMGNRIREEYDKPHSVTDLSKHKVERDSPWAMEPILRKGLPATIFGSGGIGKSTTALAICLSLASGRSIIPGMTVHEQTNALYLDWEQETDDAAEVLQSLARAAEINVQGVYHMRMSGSLTDHLEHVLTTITEHEIGFIVVDSILPASGDDIKDDIAPRLFYAAARETGATVLCLTHHSKAEPDQPYGNIYWTNLARATWKMEGEQEPESNELHDEMFNTKQNRGGIAKPIAFDLIFDEAGISYRAAEVESDSKTAVNATLTSRVHAYLLEIGAIPASEVAAHFNAAASNITRLLTSHPEMFIKVGDKRPFSWGAVQPNYHDNSDDLSDNSGMAGELSSRNPKGVTRDDDNSPHPIPDVVKEKPIYDTLPWDK